MDPNEYRERAEEALANARARGDIKLRREWLNIAGEWTALARERRAVLQNRFVGYAATTARKGSYDDLI